MKVTWVHPGWRDLVLDTLRRDPTERRRFLAASGVDGAALALAADARGAPPLLACDADWDALGDGLHRLCAELGDGDAARLLGVLVEAERGPERDALAALVLDRLRVQWQGRAVDVDALAAWLTLAAELPEPVPRPSAAATWAELEPLDAPATPADVERFADWLRLAEVLSEHDPALLARLGFPERQREALDGFTGQADLEEPPQERDLRADALSRLAWLDPVHSRAVSPAAPAPPEPGREPLPPDPGAFSVERVLLDLD